MKIQIDYSDFVNKVNEFSKEVGIDVNLVFKDQMRLLLNDLARVTPPSTASQGKKAIENDLRKIFQPTTNSDLLFLTKAFKDKIQQDIFRPDMGAAEMESIHQSRRDKRGRVRKKNTNIIKVGEKVVFAEKTYVPKSTFNSYLKQVQNKVGMTKKGFVNSDAKTLFGAKGPAFVEKSTGEMGSASIDMKPNGTGSMENINATPWVSRFSGYYNSLLKKREKDITENLGKRIDHLANKASK